MKLATKNVGHSVPTLHTRRELYRDLEIVLPEGKLTAVVGPNGSGKSTLLRQLIGIAAPERGEVLLDGEPLLRMPHRERARRIAYLPQQTPLYYDLRVREVVMLGRAPYIGRFAPPTNVDIGEVDAALAQVELTELADRGVLTLSGGELQRVMLARMLATHAPILVLDEPTTALDVGHALGFLELCKGLTSSGCTIIIAMHELELARRYAQSVLCLTGHGKTSFGTAEQIMTAATLEDVFRVRVEAGEAGIRFFPRRLENEP